MEQERVMVVIKNGDIVNPHFGKCSYCGCEFKFNDNDTKMRREMKPSCLVMSNGDKLPDEEWRFVYVNCPTCNRGVDINMFMPKKVDVPDEPKRSFWNRG